MLAELYQRLSLAVTTGAALAASGCADRPTDDDTQGGEGSAESGASSQSTGTSNGPGTVADVDTGISTTDDMILDFNLPADLGTNFDCGGGMGDPAGFQCEPPLDPGASAYGCLALIDGGCPPFSDLAVTALHLLALGAPPSLVSDAQRAAAEELEHARAFFGIASAYTGHPLGAGPLDIQGGLRDSDDATTIVVSAVKEGCIAETISALQIAAARDGARDPAIREILTRIAEQELEHAELAWRFVAWMLPRGDDRLRAAVAEAFAQAELAIPRAAAIPEGLSNDHLLALGRLSEHRQRELTRDALDRVVGPCAAALLGPWTTLASSATAARPTSLTFS